MDFWSRLKNYFSSGKISAEEARTMSGRVKLAFFGVLRRVILFICVSMLLITGFVGVMYAQRTNEQTLADSVGLVKDAMSSTSDTIFSTSFKPGEGTTKFISRPVSPSG